MMLVRFIALIFGVFVTLPIGLWLQYKVLSLINATDVMWFLFWIYVPVSIFVMILLKIVEAFDKS